MPFDDGRGFDSLVNLISGLGGFGDKSNNSIYRQDYRAEIELEAAYRTDWVARKIVDIPAEDATREWRQWEGEPAQVDAVVEAEERFALREIILDAIRKARLFGGSAILFGHEGAYELPLLEMRSGGLKSLHVIDQGEVSNQGNGLYQIRVPGGHTILAHETHFVRMVPRPFPSTRSFAGAGRTWGDSILDASFSAIKRQESVAQAIAYLVQESKVDVIKIPHFLRSVGNQEYRDRLQQRFSLANVGKSLVNALLLDKEDEWSQMSPNFAGLPDVLKTFIVLTSGAADIPVTRMFGQSPAGLSATGESDLRNYYDSVSALQRNFIAGVLKRIDEAIIISELGSVPEGLDYVWRPLWQMSSAEKAERDAKESQVFQADLNSGLFTPDEMRQMRIAQLKKADVYPGLDEIVSEGDALEAGDLPNEEQVVAEIAVE